MKKVVFFIMSKKGFYSLEKFTEKFGSSVIDYVVSSTDKHVQKDYYDEIKNHCATNKITLYNRNDNFNMEGCFVFVIGWRWMLHSKEEFFVFHDSILPRYRGFAPLVTQLLNKEKYIGVTCFLSEKEYDGGDIVAQMKKKISYPIKIEQAIDEICFLCYKILAEIYAKISKGNKLIRKPQNKSEITYSIWRDEEDYKINWNYNSEYLKRFIDSLGFPFRDAYTISDGKKIRIVNAEIYHDCRMENRDSGKVIFMEEGLPVIICGTGLLKIISAYDDITHTSILPLKKFRTRFV